MLNAIASEPSTRIAYDLDEIATASTTPVVAESTTETQSDFHRVDDLLNRCWQELDGIELNVKLTDLIRLLEFKQKLGTGMQAEREFWSLIQTIRQDELKDYGDVPPERENPN